MKKLTLVLVDDHPIVLSGLKKHYPNHSIFLLKGNLRMILICLLF